MATNPQDPNNKHNSIGLGGRTNVGALSGQTRDATSLLGNAVFAETLGGIQRNAESRAADYDILKQEAQRNQGGLEKFGTALLSGAGKGITNGINGLVSLVPYPDDLSTEGLQNWNWDIASDDFSDRSLLSNYISEGSKAIGLQTPIYSDNPYNFYTGLDAALTSVGEFAIPGKVISKGVGLAAKGVGTLVRGLGKTAANAGRMSTRARLAQYGARTDDFLTRMSMSPTNQQLFQSVGSGYLMNRFEGTVMGHQVYEEMMQELEPAINAGQLTKEEAQQYANQAALSVRSKNTAMMLTDVFAMYGIFKAKGMNRNLLDKPGFISSIKNNLLNKNVWNPLKKAAAKNPFYQALVEGAEEVIQSNIQKQSKYDALKAAEGVAASRVGKDEELVYVPDSDSYYQRLKDNLFSKDAAFEGLIGFFAGPIQSVGLESGLGLKPLLNNHKYKQYTKEIQALENQIKPGGPVTDLGKKLAIQEQIKDLKLKRAQETTRGAYEEQQEVINQIKTDVKNALKESIIMEDLVEEVQEKGVEGVEELLENTTFINTLVKHFQNGTTENLERALKDLAEGKGDPNTFGPDTAKKASDLLEKLQTLEKQWLRYYNYENKGEIFALINNQKEIENALNRTQAQKEEQQGKVLEQLRNFAPANNYSFDANGNLVITPKSKEEQEAEDDLPSQQPAPSLFPTNDEIRAFYERLAEKQELDEIESTQNVLREVNSELTEYLNKTTSAKAQREAKEKRKEREKEARREAKRALATQKSELGQRSKATTKREKSSISNAEPKTKAGKVSVTPKKTAPTPPPPGGKATPEQKRKGQAENSTGQTVSSNKMSFIQAIAELKAKQAQEVTEEESEREGFTKAKENRASTIQGTTDSVAKDPDSNFYILSDPNQVQEGDKVEFRLEPQDTGVATDPTTGKKLPITDIKLRKKEIANHENSTYGSSITEDEAVDDMESIAIYLGGKRIGYVGSPLSVTAARRSVEPEILVEEKEQLRAMRSEILARLRAGKPATGSINTITPQFYSWAEQDSDQARSMDAFDNDVVLGITVAGGIVFQGNNSTLTAAAGKKAVLIGEERFDNLIPGMVYAFIPIKKDKDGTTHYYAAPLLAQNLNDGHINTIIYVLKSWAGGIDTNEDEAAREEASQTLKYNIAKKSTASSISKLLNRFIYPYKSHPNVAEGETRTYIYVNDVEDSIQAIENVGGRPIVRAEVKRGELLTDEAVAVFEGILRNEQVQFSTDNIEGMPYVITDRDGVVQSSEDSIDFRNHMLRNTKTGMTPVPAVLAATGETIFHKSPKVTFSVDLTGGSAAPKKTPNKKTAPKSATPSKSPLAAAQQKLQKLGIPAQDFMNMSTADKAEVIKENPDPAVIAEIKAKYGIGKPATPSQQSQQGEPVPVPTKKKEDYAPEDRPSDEDEDFIDGIADDLPGNIEDDLVGDQVPTEVKDEYERNNIKGLTPVQNAEIINHLASNIFRKLVEIAEGRNEKIDAGQVYSETLAETFAIMDKTIAVLEKNLNKQSVQDNPEVKQSYESKINRIKAYKQALETDSVKLRELALTKLAKFEGIQEHRSEEDLDNLEEVAHERRNFSEDFFLTLDSKKSTSKLLRKFLSGIPLIKTVTKKETVTKDNDEVEITVVDKSIPVRTSFGAPVYANFDEVYNKLHSLEVGSDSNLKNQLKKLAQLYIDYPGMREQLNWMPGLIMSLDPQMLLLDGNVKTERGLEKDLGEAFLETFMGEGRFEESFLKLNKLMAETGFGKPAGEKIRRQFAINMSKAKVKAPLVLYRAVRKGGKITFEVNVTDHNNSDNSRQILDEMQESFLNKLYVFNTDTEEYDLDIEAANRAVKMLKDYIAEPPTQKNSDGYKRVRQRFLEMTGIPISVQTFHTLATKGYQLDKVTIKLNGRARNVFKTEGTPFNALLRSLEESIASNSPFNPNVNPFTDNAIKRLAFMESTAQASTLSNAFRVGEKTIYTYTEHNYASSQIQRILRDKAYREKLQSTVFAGDSLWLHLMTEEGNQIISIDPSLDAVQGLELGILNFRPVKEMKETNLTTEDLDKQNLNDNIFTRLALFTANATKTRKSIKKKDEQGKELYSLPVRSGTVVPLTYSDKHTTLTVTTNMPIFTIGSGGGVTSNTINLFYEHVLMAEANRIFQTQLAEDSNDAAYENGKSSFILFPEMNTTEVVDSSGNIDSVINHAINGKLDRNHPDYDATVAEGVKIALGNQLNQLINEQLELFKEAGINVASKETPASFISSAYVDMIKVAQKDAGVPVKEELLNQAIAADYTLNHMLAAANMFQLFVKDPALYTKASKDEDGNVTVDHESTLDNIQKRLAALIAPGTATAVEEEGDSYIQLFANDVKYLDSLQDSFVKFFSGIKNPKYKESYKNAEITDGQELITYKEYLGTMLKQGQITQKEYDEITKVVKDPDADIPDWMMSILFGAEKPVAVADKFITLSNGKSVEKRIYIKSSGLPLIPKFTKGTDLDNLRKSMEDIESKSGLPVRLAFGSGVKVGLPSTAKKTNIQYTEKDAKAEFDRRTANRTLSKEQVDEIRKETDAMVGKIKSPEELTAMFRGTLTDEDLNGEEAYLEDQSLRAPMQILERKYWRIQQATPSKQTDEATRGTQESKIILSEVLEAFPEEKAKEIINNWERLHSKLFQLRAHKVGIEIFNPDGTIDKKALAEFLDKDAKSGGVDANTRYGLQVDQNGNYLIPLDLSPGTLSYQTLINAVVNKKIAQKKIKGQSTVLMTEFGFAITQGQDLSKSGIIWTEGFDFEYGKLKPARFENGEYKPAQVVLPNKFYIDGKVINLKKYTKKGPQGQLILDTAAIPQEILKGFTFRIPTQGYNSMSGIEIVGFLPDTMGDVVVAPGAFVNQMGSDFDIDKLFNYFYKLRKGPGNKFEKVSNQSLMEAELGSLSEKELDELENSILNEALDLRLEIMANENIYQSTTAPLDFGLLKYSNETVPFEAAGLPEFKQTMESTDPDKELGLKHFFKQRKAKQTASSRNPLSPVYHTLKYQDARGAGAGVGVFARAITFQSMAQVGKSTIVSPMFRLGRYSSSNISNSQSVTNKSRSKISVLTAFLSAALDNEKEQIMNYLNINDDTFGVATVMIHAGFEEDLVLAFVESPILRALSKYKKSRTTDSFEETLSATDAQNLLLDTLLPKGLKGEAREEAVSELIEQASELLAGQESETRGDTFTRMIKASEVEIKLVPGRKQQLLFVDKNGKPLQRGDELKTAQLYALGSLMLRAKLKGRSLSILNAQSYLNTDSSGIGKNAYEVYDTFSKFMEDSGYGTEDGPTDIFSSIVGDLQVLELPDAAKFGEEPDSNAKAEFDQKEAELLKQGFRRVGRLPGQTVVAYLKPASASAMLYAEANGVGTKIYDDTMPAIVDFVVNNLSIVDESIPESIRFVLGMEKKAKRLHDALRSVLYASAEDWVSESLAKAFKVPEGTPVSVYGMREFFAYDQDNNIAALVKNALGDKRFAKNPFLKSLITSTKAGERAKATYSNFNPDGLLDEDKSNAFSQLFLEPDQSPIVEGGPTPAELGALLVSYAIITGGNQKALEYIKFVPNSYLVGSGFYKIIENKLKESVKNPELASSIAVQLVQHNPTSTYRKRRTQNITQIDGTTNYKFSGEGVKVKQNQLTGEIYLAIGKKTLEFLHSKDKNGRVSLFYFNPEINTPGSGAILTKVDVLGDGGDFSEFSAAHINGKSETAFGLSIIPSNKKDYIEEAEEAPTETPEPGKVKFQPNSANKVSRKLELPKSGEANPVQSIQAIAASSDTPSFRQLAAAFLTRKDELGKVNFTVESLGEGKVAGGSYNHSTKSVKVSYSNNQFYTEQAILHEFGHALTKEAIEAFEKGGTYPNAKVKQAMQNIAKVQSLYADYVRALNNEELEAFKAKYDEYRRRKDLPPSERNALPLLDFSDKEEVAKYYSALKLSEFVTMVLSDPLLQQELDKVIPSLETAVKVSGDMSLKSLFKTILDALKDILEGLTGVKLSDYTIEQAMVIVTQGQSIPTIEDTIGETESPLTTPSSESLSLITAIEQLAKAVSGQPAPKPEPEVKPRYKLDFIKKVISGGQTGTDINALQAAKRLGYEVGGIGTYGNAKISKQAPDLNVIPLEDVELTPEEELFIATKKQNNPKWDTEVGYNIRTYLNINRSDVTVLYVPEDGVREATSKGKTYKQIDAAKSPGSFLTVQLALELNRPFIINPTAQELNRFLFKHKPGVVNITGSGADKWTKGLTDFKAKNKIYSQLQSTISEGISTTSQSAKAAKTATTKPAATPKAATPVASPEPATGVNPFEEQFSKIPKSLLLIQLRGLLGAFKKSPNLEQAQKIEAAANVLSISLESDVQEMIDGFLRPSDDLPGDTITVPDPMVTDLGMDITDFLKQLTPEQRRFYTQLFNEGKFTVKCRR